MIRGLLILLSFFIFVGNVFGFELVLPKEKNSATTANYAFFVGKSKGFESLSINGESVFTASNGAFAHSVKLKEGENRIIIRTNYGAQIYKIYKSKAIQQEFPIEDMEPVKAYVNKDNTPLRSTPVDAGLNRIGHLFGGTHLVINGSKGDFLRVKLSGTKTAWIAKKDVTITNENFYPADFMGMDTERYKNAMIQTISFSKKLPYTVEDTDKEIIFRVYNPELSDESVYNLNIPKPEKYAYTISLEEGKYTFKVRKLPEDLKDALIVIDAGHGGSEKGAIGCLGDEEKNINLKIAQHTAQLLKDKGLNVEMTRDFDANVSLSDRVDIARENNADIFVSIHLNSIADIPMNIHKNRGTSVYYFNNNSKSFAETMENCLTSSAGTHNDGVKTASFAVIRPPEYVGVLVEVAYMTNPLDSVLYTNDKFIRKAAKGIADGIMQYYKH